MFWKIEALTAKRTEITQSIEGSLEDVKNQAAVYDLEILDIRPDYWALIKNFFEGLNLPATVLTLFFNDFADMQKSGLSIKESIAILNETNSNTALKEALRKITNFINDGRSLEESFENTKVFPKVVSVTLSAAEKTGNIPELLELLAQYFKFKHENKKKMARSMIYPGVVLCMLTGLSIFISMTLVPQMRAFLPPSTQNLSAIILIGYSDFIKEYWWVVILFLGLLMYLIKYLWGTHREKLMETVFNVPLLGNLMKNMELSHIFLNLYVYQKSGVNIIETISNIHQANKTYITDKLILIRERIFKGTSLGDAFKQDKFFPSFVCQNLAKGQISGNLAPYFERIYKYYDIKSKESIAVMLAMVEPLLMVMTASFLLMIVCAFILPVYSNMNHIGERT